MGLPSRATDSMAAGFLRASKGESERERVCESVSKREVTVLCTLKPLSDIHRVCCGPFLTASH